MIGSRHPTLFCALPAGRCDLCNRLRSVLESDAWAIEQADGPRWSEALREGRRLRERAAAKRDKFGWPPAEVFVTDDPSGGIPVGWISRP